LSARFIPNPIRIKNAHAIQLVHWKRINADAERRYGHLLRHGRQSLLLHFHFGLLSDDKSWFVGKSEIWRLVPIWEFSRNSEI
jgi:hypothetical protein